MPGVNKVILVGNVGRDPEIRSLNSGSQVANFSLATSENWRDKQTGERKEKTEWHRIAVFNEGLVKVVEQYVRKGAKLYVEGKLETRKWTDQQGQEKYTTEIVLTSFDGKIQMLDSRRDGDRGDAYDNGGGDYDPNRGTGARRASNGAGGTHQAPQAGRRRNAHDELDDDIPFVTSDPAFETWRERGAVL